MLAARAAAILAVVLLTFASIQSVVMQAAEAAAPAMPANCPMGMAGMDMSMPGMDMTHEGGAPAEKGGGAKVCAFCSAAAHAALLTLAAPLPVSIAVAWLTYAPTATRGVADPPPFLPKARGPPASPTA